MGTKSKLAIIIGFIALLLNTNLSFAEFPYVSGGFSNNYTQSIVGDDVGDGVEGANMIAGVPVIVGYTLSGATKFNKCLLYNERGYNRVYAIKPNGLKTVFTDDTSYIRGISSDGNIIYLLVYSGIDYKQAIIKLTPKLTQ